MQYFAIIVAGGSGQRMSNPTPKQFLLLDKIPILMRTLHAFHRSAKQPEIIVVLAPGLQDQWTSLCHKFRFHVPHYIADGGATRFQSVRNGLDFIVENHLAGHDPEQTIIAVHDGARPLISSKLIDESFQKAERTGAVALGIPCTDSIRRLNPDHPTSNEALPREQIYRIQTPQTFRGSLLLRAYKQAEEVGFTDDVTVVEKMGLPITIMEGDPKNLKITYRSDLSIAAAYLRA